MKNFILLLAFLITGVASNAQDLRFEVEGMGDTTIYMARYFGPKLYYADTAYSSNGVAVFDGKKHPGGLYAVVIPGGQYFEFIHDDEKVDMYIGNSKDLIGSMDVKKSVNNKVFYDYIMFMTDNKKKGAALNNEYKAAAEGSDEQEKIKDELSALNESVVDYQKTLITENEGKFVAVMIKMSMDIELPESPKDENGVITDSNYVYQYYINHYWDNVDLQDERIVRTPIFHNKIDKYFSQQGVVQIPDSIIKYADILLSQMDQEDQENKVFQYSCHHITYKYESSKIMGMDKVFWHMAVSYYCDPNNKAFWMTEENSNKVCERARKIGKTVIGNYAPMLILPDTTETNWINSYQIDAEYTVLYFWDPNCGHCKKVTPKLQVLYDEKFKERNIEIYAVGKATGDDFEDWKEFIRENKLTFINVGLTPAVYNQAMEDPAPLMKHTNIQSLNYTDTYDIYSTPRIFILGPDKKIMFKQLSIGQLEAILDDLTGHHDDEKLFPIEDPENGPGGGEEENHPTH